MRAWRILRVQPRPPDRFQTTRRVRGSWRRERDYRLVSGRVEGEGASKMVAYGALEWSFLAALVILVGGAGVFALFLVLQLFRNPSRRR